MDKESRSSNLVSRIKRKKKFRVKKKKKSKSMCIIKRLK